MPWAAAGAIGGALINKSASKGGGGQQTASKEPWAAAAPWLEENLRRGQELQGQYQQTPFSFQQNLAYGHQMLNSDDQRNFVESILGQMNKRQGFDRSNPNARPQPFQMPQLTPRMNFQGMYAAGQDPFATSVLRAPTQQAAPAPTPAPADPFGGMQWDQYQAMYGGGS